MYFWQRTQARLQIWQFLFLSTAITWLWAPYVNHLFSVKATLISQYEVPSQPYSWLFRLGDVLAGLLVLLAVTHVQKHYRRPVVILGLSIIGVGMVLDPLLSVQCLRVNHQCIEPRNGMFYLHAIETVWTSLAILIVSVDDTIRRRALPSMIFVIFQLAYGLLYLSQLAHTYNFETLSQFIYQLLTIIWLAWFIRECISSQAVVASLSTNKQRSSVIKRGIALWAAINGVLAILLSLTHLHLFGFIRTFYFANGTAWLAEHGVIVGVILLYISRHLARGERRARQLFLFLAFLEIIKYALITPQPVLLLLYSFTFILLFIAQPYFDRGTTKLSWQSRLQDASVIVMGVALAASAAAIVLSQTRRRSRVMSRVFHHFSDFALHIHSESREYMASTLLAHTLFVLIIAAIAFILWSLFRPTKILSHDISDSAREEVKQFIKRYAASSEDYFKIWPEDKQYFWSQSRRGLIAYKVVGPIAFALADPIAMSSKAQDQTLQEFMRYCRSHGLRVCFLPVDESSLQLYTTNELNTVHIGSSATVTVSDFVEQTAGSKWMRWQHNRGERAGYHYSRSTPPHSPQLIKQFTEVSNLWLQKDGRHEQSFALGYYDTSYLQSCTIHYIHDDSGSVLAFVNEVPVFNNLDQTTIDLIRYQQDATGAIPFLLLQIIQSLHEQGRYKKFDLGFVPLAQVRGTIAQLARILGARRFSAAGLEQFKGKFKPDWHKNYVAYDGDVADLALVVVNLEKALKP